MHPLLRRDPARAAWIDTTAAELHDLAAACRTELDAANRQNRFPRDVYRELGRRGYVGLMAPTEWGGLGRGVQEYVVVNEEIACNGLVSTQVASQGIRWLLDWGTDEQRTQWLEGIATGRLVFSESISEKQAGSSLRAMKATAVRDGTDWIINGNKTHVNLGADCQVTLAYVMAPEGLTSFLIDTALPGVRTRVTEAIGSRLIRTADVEFADVRVPADAILGEPGGGMQTFLSTFNVSRLGNASDLVGLGRRMLHLGLKYAQERKVGAQVVTDFQGIQWMVANAWTALQAASLARDHAAIVCDAGEDISLHTSTAKQLAVSAAESASETAYSLTGGHSLYHDEPYTDIDNEIKVYRVAGGSVEILRNFVARRVFSDPGHEGLA